MTWKLYKTQISVFVNGLTGAQPHSFVSMAVFALSDRDLGACKAENIHYVDFCIKKKKFTSPWSKQDLGYIKAKVQFHQGAVYLLFTFF